MKSEFEKREEKVVYAIDMKWGQLGEVVGGNHKGYVIARAKIPSSLWVVVHTVNTDLKPFEMHFNDYEAQHIKVRILGPEEKIILSNG